MANCKSCGSSIQWIKSATSGKSIICNLDLYHWEDIGADLDCIVVTKTGEVGKLRFKKEGFESHWATCPDAKRWRK